MRTLVVLTVLLMGHQSESSLGHQLKTFILEELVPLRIDFFPEKLSINWVSESEYVYSEPGQGIRKYNAETNAVVTIVDRLEMLNLSRYSVASFSNDQKFLLLTKNKQKIYRHSSIAEYYVYDTELKQIVGPLAQGIPLQVVKFGSDRSLAYVKDNNVHYVPDCSQPENVTKLTEDGVPGEVYIGATDWLYEEEVFSAPEAMWFSPSGTYLAAAVFDDSNVSSAVFPFYGPVNTLDFQYTHEIRFKYPKAGRANPLAELRVFKPDDQKADAWNIPAPTDILGIDVILGRVSWATDKNLVVLWLNRRQNHSVLLNCDLQLDKCNTVKERKEPNGWIDIDNPIFSSDAIFSGMVGIAPQYYGSQRYMHVVEHDFYKGETDLTPGNSTVTDVLAWNKEEDTVYYIISPEDKPWERQLWVTIGKESRCVSCREPVCHTVSAMMAPRGKYGVVVCSAVNTPPHTYLYKAQNDQFKLLKDNAKLAAKLSQYKLPMVLFNKLILNGNVTAHVKLLLPPEVVPHQRYPMIVRIYAGPGTTRVKDNYDLEYYNSYLAGNKSYIVASIDVRGSGAMEVDALHAVNNALGTVEISDTLEAIRALIRLYPFIDPRAIGVWGWSYGGFATTMMLITDHLKTIKCGAAIAPVTSWAYYDTIYTERYMDTPANNPVGYQHSNLMLLAEGLRGKEFLLVHGTGDDNVHYQHSLQLAKVLQHSDIAFEQMSYTDEAHSLLGVVAHFYHTLDRFWTQCFKP